MFNRNFFAMGMECLSCIDDVIIPFCNGNMAVHQDEFNSAINVLDINVSLLAEAGQKRKIQFAYACFEKLIEGLTIALHASKQHRKEFVEVIIDLCVDVALIALLEKYKNDHNSFMEDNFFEDDFIGFDWSRDITSRSISYN